MAARALSFVVGLILFLAGVTVVRMVYFDGLAIGADQAGLAAWLAGLHAAPHWLPVPGPDQGWLDALAADRTSVLGTLLQPIRDELTVLVDLGPLAWYAAGTAVFGDGPGAWLQIGLLAQTVMLFLLALLPRYSRRSPGEDAGWLFGIGGTAVALAVFTAALHGLAPLGAANVGVMALIATLLAGGRLLATLVEVPAVRFCSLLPLILVQAFALYAAITNLIVVPAAMVLGILVSPGLGGKRLAALGRYVLLTVVTLLPLIVPAVLAALDGSQPLPTVAEVSELLTAGSRDLVAQASDGRWQAAVFAAAGDWYAIQSTVLAPAALAPAVAGLLILAVSYGVVLPLMAVLVLAVAALGYAVSPGVALFALPLLLVGGATFALTAIRLLAESAGRPFQMVFGTLAALVVIGVIVDLARVQGPALLDLRQAALVGPAFAAR